MTFQYFELGWLDLPTFNSNSISSKSIWVQPVHTFQKYAVMLPNLTAKQNVGIFKHKERFNDIVLSTAGGSVWLTSTYFLARATTSRQRISSKLLVIALALMLLEKLGAKSAALHASQVTHNTIHSFFLLDLCMHWHALHFVHQNGSPCPRYNSLVIPTFVCKRTRAMPACIMIRFFFFFFGHSAGLDPTEPYFRDTDAAVRLDTTDATFVDVIHTDGHPFSTKLGTEIIDRND